MTTLYLVRHGETDWNAQRRIQGSTDIPLNDVGRAQAVAAGRLLAQVLCQAVVTSPLSRAFETATIIADEMGLPAPVCLSTLVERSYGEAEGLDWREVDARFPDDATVPGRETREEVTARVVPALLELALAHPEKAVVVVTHGGVIRSVLNLVDPDTDHGPIANGSIHSVRQAHGSLQLLAFNDPIEQRSIVVGAGDIAQQNSLERRDTLR